jgi:hypothetical protein
MQNEPKAASSLLHKALVATSGAVGGSFGLAALPVELPISTIIMLRSIGDVARSEGEDLADPDTALACLQVFALGGLKGKTDGAESGYFAVRGLLAKSVAEAARFIAERGGVAMLKNLDAYKLAVVKLMQMEVVVVDDALEHCLVAEAAIRVPLGVGGLMTTRNDFLTEAGAGFMVGGTIVGVAAVCGGPGAAIGLGILRLVGFF